MNEVLFTKGDIQGAEHLVPLLDSRCNCVLVHPGGNTSPCHANAHGKEGQIKAIQHLIKWEGYQQLHDYVSRMEKFMKGSQCTAAHRLIDLAYEGMPHGR